jgi:hypothetical protein
MPTRSEYVRNVARDSFMLWEHGQRIAVFSGVVLGSLLLGVFLALGVAITFKPEAGWWVSGVLVIWLVFLVLVVSPYRVWAREREKVEDIEEAAKPTINVDWRFRSGMFAEMILTNMSSKTLPRVVLSFRNYRKSDGSGVTDVLQNMLPVGGNQSSIRLDPFVQTFFRFALIKKRKDGNSYIQLTPSGQDPIDIDDREIGVKLAVSGENIPSQAINFRLSLDDKETLSIEPWKVGEKAVSAAGIP